MNKQEETIKKLESIKAIGNDAIAACYNESMNAGITLMKKLDEPHKPVVPKFVADWFEENKDALDLAIFIAIRGLDDEEWPHETDFENWLDNAENNPIETLVRMKDGYEVEKELKWKIINDQKYCLTSIEAGYDNSLHWAFDSTKKKPILFDDEETALYTAYITGGTVEKVEV